MAENYDTVRSVAWCGDRLHLLDQRRLPQRTDFVSCTTAIEVADAIRTMVVRGAPAIGIAAAYGVVLSVLQHQPLRDGSSQAAVEQAAVEKDMARLSAARPTAVNLDWALQRMAARLKAAAQAHDPAAVMLQEATAIQAEDLRANHRMGELGAQWLAGQTGSVLTHCNTGSLATGGYGTALGVIRSAFARGWVDRVYAGETRPWLQGARLTVWELQQEGIPTRLITDSAAAHLMAQRRVRWVIVGADRIAANGDVANKIGTYGLAVLARAHGVRFMVVAPCATIDVDLGSGREIALEQRGADEVRTVRGTAVAPEGVPVWNPAFDVTPAHLVDVLVTERGAVNAPTRAAIQALLAGDGAQA